MRKRRRTRFCSSRRHWHRVNKARRRWRSGPRTLLSSMAWYCIRAEQLAAIIASERAPVPAYSNSSVHSRQVPPAISVWTSASRPSLAAPRRASSASRFRFRFHSSSVVIDGLRRHVTRPHQSWRSTFPATRYCTDALDNTRTCCRHLPFLFEVLSNGLRRH